jgi:hypothetical protein
VFKHNVGLIPVSANQSPLIVRLYRLLVLEVHHISYCACLFHCLRGVYDCFICLSIFLCICLCVFYTTVTLTWQLSKNQPKGDEAAIQCTIPPRVPENPAYRKPTHALHHSNVNICQEVSMLSEYTLRTSALVSTYPLLLLSSVALTIPYLVVGVQNSLSSVSLGSAL